MEGSVFLIYQEYNKKRVQDKAQKIGILRGGRFLVTEQLFVGKLGYV
jgi:hypothetical protein